MEDILFDLYYSSVLRNLELDQTIEGLQGELKYRKNENLNLHKENQYFERRIDDLKKENNNLRRNIEYLCDENVRLRHEINEVQNNDNNY